MDQVRKFFQDVHGAEIVDAVYGVQPQSVDMILRDPVQRIVEDEAADLVAVRSVIIDGRTPGACDTDP